MLVQTSKTLPTNLVLFLAPLYRIYEVSKITYQKCFS